MIKREAARIIYALMCMAAGIAVTNWLTGISAATAMAMMAGFLTGYLMGRYDD